MKDRNNAFFHNNNKNITEWPVLSTCLVFRCLMLTFLSFNNRINVQESPWGRVGKIQRHVLMVVEVEQGSMIIFMSYKENIL